MQSFKAFNKKRVLPTLRAYAEYMAEEYNSFFPLNLSDKMKRDFNSILFSI